METHASSMPIAIFAEVLVGGRRKGRTVNGVGVGEGVGVGVGVDVGLGVAVGDGVAVGLGVAVAVGVAVGDGVGVAAATVMVPLIIEPCTRQ